MIWFNFTERLFDSVMVKIFLSSFLVLIQYFIVSSQNKMKFYEDTSKMKVEVLSFIPLGTDTATCKQIMLHNKFNFIGAYVNETFLRGGNIDFLFFFHDEGVIFYMNRWKIALVHKKGKLSDIQIQFVIIGL